MDFLLTALHVVVCVALIIIVLLQAGKGAEIGAAFGAGASQTVFGATGSRDFMSKLTTAAAIIFMLTSLTLAYFYGQPDAGSIMPATVGTPAAQQPAPAMPIAPPVVPGTNPAQ